MAKTNMAEPAEKVESGDAPLIDLNEASLKKLIARAKKRGYITVDDLNAVVGDMSTDQIEDVMSALNEMGVNVVENEEQSEDDQAEDAAEDEVVGVDEGESGPVLTQVTKKETVDRTDDPVRMYLREMGAVELLSREGEIAIAKRIEAGRDTMILGLCESPITFNAIIDWSTALNEGTMQLREILDLDAMLSKGPTAEQVEGAEDENGEISEESTGPTFKEEEEPEEASADEDEDGLTERRAPRPSDDEEEDNTLSLAQMEEQLKPLALEKFATITDLYKKFHKMQIARLEAMGAGGEFPANDEKKYQKLREELTAEVESVQFHGAKIEYLVDQLYSFNRRLMALGGQMLRLAERHKVPRKAFLDAYVGHETEEGWVDRVSGLDKKWAAFAANEAAAVERIRAEVAE
ncbi:MAG: RNA polymerase sigma factor region1.1 domain-containing protein, partial [Sphingomonadaceae bacterium]